MRHEHVRRLGASLLVMGSDWSGRFDHLAGHCAVRYLPRTENVSSTRLKVAIRRAPPPEALVLSPAYIGGAR